MSFREKALRGWPVWVATILLGIGVIWLLAIRGPRIPVRPELTPIPTIGIAPTRISAQGGMRQFYVPAGSFLMGSDVRVDPLAQGNELPQHTVTLSGYWIDRTEVTNAMYARCVAAGSCSPPQRAASPTRGDYYTHPQYAAYPVTWVGWSQANAYCRWVGQRLPTEAEWEKAARGPDGRIYPWGSQAPTCSLANYWGQDGGCTGDTTSVGSSAAGASPYGALDMSGNVFEWVADWYSGTYYETSPAVDPPGPASGDSRVLRGGSWGSGGRTVHAAVRLKSTPGGELDDVGFRCASSSP